MFGDRFMEYLNQQNFIDFCNRMQNIYNSCVALRISHKIKKNKNANKFILFTGIIASKI